jgi:hypothetical protein
MIAQLIRQESFSQCLSQVELALERRRADLAAGNGDAIETADEYKVSLADLDEALQTVRQLRQTDLPKMEVDPRDAAWMPRDPLASILQSFLDEFYTAAGAVEEQAGQGLGGREFGMTNRSLRPEWAAEDPQGLARALESTDPRWASSFAAAKTLKMVRGQHKFPDAPPTTVKLGEKARVILVGDWGSGLPRAIKVRDRIQERLFETDATGRDLHVIHLGDVYYSGFESEYKKRFLANWPVNKGEASRIGSWCLNGNHDMFTGGHAYFDFLLKEPRFARQGGTSYFALENEVWQILGLDTAYNPPDPRGNRGDLFGLQAQWVKDKRAAVPAKKAVLLSHHQLFSPYEGGSPRLAEKLAPVIADPHGITAWFWAHEHRCVIYDQSHPVKNGRLLGHGGVPVYASSGALPEGVIWEFRDSFRDGFETFARFGFAVLDFDPDRLSVQYIDENGTVNRREEIT